MTSRTVVPHVVVENKMMYDHRMISAAPGAGQAIAMRLPDGTVNVLVHSSFPSSLWLHRYYPDFTKLTGWAREETNLPGVDMGDIVVGYDTSGSPMIFVATADVGAFKSAADTQTPLAATIYQISVSPTLGLSAPKPLHHYNTTSPSLSFDVATQTLSWSLWDSTAQVAQCLNMFDPSSAYVLIDGDSHPYPLGAGAAPVMIPNPGGAAWPILDMAMIETNGYIIALRTQVTQTSVLRSTTSVLPEIDDSNGNIIPATSLAAACYPNGVRRLFATVGDGKVRILSARPASDGTLQWDSAWQTPDLGTNFTSDLRVEVETLADHSITLAHTDGLYNVWVSEHGVDPSLAWTRGMNVLGAPIGEGAPAPVGSAFLTDQGDFGYAYADPAGYIHIATRDNADSWQSTQIDVQDGTASRVVSVYRVGLVISDSANNGAPLINEPIAVHADNEVNAFINGHLTYFSKDEPKTLTTDANGCIWLMIDVADSIAVPMFSVSSPTARFAEAILIRPEADAQNHSTNASADDLRAATDQNGNLLLGPNAPVDVMAEKLHELNTALAGAYAPREHRSDRLIVAARAGVRVIQPGEAGLLTSDIDLSAISSWQMVKDKDGFRFQNLDAASYQQTRNDLITRVAIERGLDPTAVLGSPDGFFDDWDDAFDWIGDAIVDAGNAVIGVVEGVLKATIQFTIDGISRIVDMAVSAIGSIPIISDVVAAVMNFAGAVLGKVVGWLVRAIGWLFGLPDLQAIRDKIRNAMSAAIIQLPSLISKPSIIAGQAHDQLESWKDDIHQLIQSYETSPAGSQSNTSAFGGAQSIMSSLAGLSSNISGEASWIIEKLVAALPNLGPSMPVGPDFGVDAILQDLGTKAGSVTTNLVTLLADVETSAMQSWIQSITDFDGANIDPVLQAFDRHITGLLDDLAGMTTDLGNAGDAVWANPQKIVYWLDQPIHIPFFSSFYEGLSGNDFSLLDFVAYAAAIPYSIVGPSTSAHDTNDNESKEVLLWMIFSLKAIKAFAGAIAAGYQEPGTSDTGHDSLGEFAERFVTASDLLISILTLVYAADDEAHWTAPATADLFSVVCKTLIDKLSGTGPDRFAYGTVISDSISIFGGGLAGLLESLRDDVKLPIIGNMVLGMTSDLAHIMVDRGVIDVEGETKLFYAAFQGVLLGGQAGVFLADALSPDDQAVSPRNLLADA